MESDGDMGSYGRQTGEAVVAEPFETLREVGVALDAFRSEVTGHFSTMKWIIGGVSAAGLLAAGVLFAKIDRLEESAARNTAILERIEVTVNRTAANTDEIKSDIQSAGPVPASDTFKGLVGVNADQLTSDAVRDLIEEKGGASWIYLPQD